MHSQRLQSLNGHFEPQDASFNTSASVGSKQDDDVVVVSFARTAMTKARRGAQAQTPTESMLTPVLKEVIKQAGIDAKQVEDVCIGNVLSQACGADNGRMGAFLAGIPHTTPFIAINRKCSSGLQAVMTVANQIRSGEIDIGIGGGVESMTYNSMQQYDPKRVAQAVYDHPLARNLMTTDGMTSENVCEQFGITREQMDQMAFESHAKAANAQKQGWLQQEITPYETTVTDKAGNKKTVLVDKDEGIRPTTTLAGLAKLKAAFKPGGTTTAGNASQLTDGAAVVLLARRSHAVKLGLPIKGRILSFAVGGVPPEIMGIGPVVAIPKALGKCQLEVKDIDVWEVNEAFASQAYYCVDKLNIPKNKLNQRGGAIALGHPLGMTGARMICTMFAELERLNAKTGVVSMCIGTGMGAAGVFEREI